MQVNNIAAAAAAGVSDRRDNTLPHKRFINVITNLAIRLSERMCHERVFFFPLTIIGPYKWLNLRVKFGRLFVAVASIIAYVLYV